MSVDHSGMKLGKLEFKHDPRTLALASYRPNTMAAPPSCDYTGPVKRWPMMLNDRLGDCTCAAVGHIVQGWSANAGAEAIIGDADIRSMYSAVSGYDPATGKNDNGAYEIVVLNWWRKNPVAGHRLTAFASLEPANLDQVRLAIYLFGAAYLGVALPITAQSQQVWSVASKTGPGAPGSWGGHAVPLVAYDPQGFTCVTWGGLKRLTNGFLQTYCDEAYALLGTDWIKRGTLLAPNAVNFQALELDIGQFGPGG